MKGFTVYKSSTIESAEWETLRCRPYENRSVWLYKSRYAMHQWLVELVDRQGQVERRELYLTEREAWQSFHSISMAEAENDSKIWFDKETEA